MSQPQPFTRSYSYTNSFAANPTQTFPGSALDAELNDIANTTNQILQNLTLLQNDSGTVRNGTIGPQQLSPSLQIGFLPPVVWQPHTNYATSPAATVFNANKFYSCAVSNTSSASFATDLAAGYWILIADLSSIPVQTATDGTELMAVPRIVCAIILLNRGEREEARRLLAVQARDHTRNPSHPAYVVGLAKRLGIEITS